MQQRQGLLVVTRQRDEKVHIGDDIEITVMEIRGDKVRLGFLAPRNIPVHRHEVFVRVCQEQRNIPAEKGGAK